MSLADVEAFNEALRAYTHPAPRANGRPAPDAKPEPPKASSAQAAPRRPRIISGETLMDTAFPPLRWALWNIIPQGYTVLAGPPKLGKTWLIYQLSVAVAAGGMLFGQDTQRAPVLLLALEDGGRRAQDRMRKVLDGERMPAGLEVAFDWPKLDEGGLDLIDEWAAKNPGGLIPIDTLAKVKQSGRRGGNTYDVDNEIHAPLHRICRDRQVTIISVTHLRKGRGEDFVEAITGSTGIVGTADSIIVLERQRGQMDGVLKITGRDVEEQELALRLDKDRGQWSCMGEASQYRGSENSRRIIQALHGATEKGMSPGEVAERSGVNRGAVKTALHRMADRGDVRNLGGRYTLP